MGNGGGRKVGESRPVGMAGRRRNDLRRTLMPGGKGREKIPYLFPPERPSRKGTNPAASSSNPADTDGTTPLMVATRQGVTVVGEIPVQVLLGEAALAGPSNHSDTTHYRLKLNVESFSKFLPPRMRVRKLLPLHLIDWLDQRCPKRPPKGGKPASDNTRHDYATDVMAAFNWAVKQRLIPSSPL
jgi:hypothetical protein